MRTIDIAEILSPELKSRVRAQDLKLFVENSGEDSVAFDFHNVLFATRSFIDEFYNLFLKNPSENGFKVKIINVPEDINTMLESVSRTQMHFNLIPPKTPVQSFNDVKEFLRFLGGTAI